MAGQAGKIGDLFIEIKAAGVEAAGMAIAGVTASLRKLVDMAKLLPRELYWTGQGLGDLFKGASMAAQSLGGSVSGLVMPLQGMVMQGIAASSAGQLMTIQFQELNRQLASAFVPTIRFVSERLAALIGWFRGLSGQQQKVIREWGLLLAGLVTASVILPRVIAAVQMLAGVFKALQVAMVGLALSNPLLLIAAAISVVVVGAVAWKLAMKDAADATKRAADAVKEIKPVGFWKAMGTPNPAIDSTRPAGVPRPALPPGSGGKSGEVGPWAKIFAGLGGPLGGVMGQRLDIGARANIDLAKRTELMPALGPIEDPAQSWKRLAQTSRNVGGLGEKTDAQKQTDALEEILGTVRRIGDKMNISAPATPPRGP